MSRLVQGFVVGGCWVEGLRSSVYSDIRENLAYFKGLFDLQTAGRTTWNLRGSKVLANWRAGSEAPQRFREGTLRDLLKEPLSQKPEPNLLSALLEA